MAKIVIDARTLRDGTTGRYIERLLHYLQKPDDENDYIILLKLQDFDGWTPGNSRFSKVACPYREFTLGEQLGYAWQLKKLKADLVHFGMTHQPVLYFGKTVTTIHDLTTARFSNPAKNQLVFSFKQLIYKWVIRRVAKKSVVVITPTKFVKDDVAQFAKISPDKITVTYEAADPIENQPEPLAQMVGKDFLLYVGRATPHKNLERAIEAFAKVQTSRPNLKFVLGGKLDDNYKLLKKYAAQHSIKNLVFTDFVSDGQLRWLYENAKVYVFPSLSEGFGLPGLEAMVHGLPVAAAEASCLPEVYKDAAHYFDPNDADDIAKIINEVLSDNKLRSKLIANGQKLTAQYSWQKMAAQTLEIYKKVLNT